MSSVQFAVDTDALRKLLDLSEILGVSVDVTAKYVMYHQLDEVTAGDLIRVKDKLAPKRRSRRARL